MTATPSEDQIVLMTLACHNVDRDATGWFALIVDKVRQDKMHLGRGATAWEAVRNAHHIASLFNQKYDLENE